MPRWFVPLALAALLAASTAASGGAQSPVPAVPPLSIGAYSWPVLGQVIRPFELTEGPFGPGHRGIDIGVRPGAVVRASAAGVVAFAGRIAGELHVSIDHPDGIRTSYSYLHSVEIRRGDSVRRGETVGTAGAGHAGIEPRHLHFGARFAGGYIDPMLLLERGSLVGLIHLAPTEEGEISPVP